jgi:diguanylate cyclase (GGDEF)-like protein/PAS domain S-box-containing protein
MNIKKINIVIFLIFLLSFVVNIYIFYQEQKSIMQNELLDDIKSALIDSKYILSKELEKNSQEYCSTYIEQKAFTSNYIKSISIADNNTIIVSSDKKLQNQDISKNIVDIVNIEKESLKSDAYYKIDIKYINDNSSYKVYLLIDVDESFLTNQILNGFQQSISATLIIPLLLFITLWLFTQTTLLKPIQKIERLIKDKKNIDEKFFVEEIERLKKHTIESFEQYESIQQKLSKQVVEKSNSLVVKESKLNTLFDNINEGVVIYQAVDNGEDFRIIDFNKFAQTLENKTLDEVQDKLVTEIFPSIKEFGLFDILKSVYESGKSQYFPVSFYEDEKISGWKENYIYKLPTGEIVVIYNDITKQKQYEESLKNLNYELKDKIDIINKNVIISTTDKDGIITDVSEAFCNISGYKKSELVGKPHNIVRHPHMEKETFDNMWSVIKNGYTWSGEVKNMKKGGGDYWVEAKIYPIFGKNGKISGYTSLRQNITNKKKIEELSITDELTTVYNRRYFNSVFTKEVYRSKRENKSITFAMIDVDDFKKYNDTYGHQKGDEVLEKLGKILKSHFRRGSDYPFRLGGEEFGVLFSNFTQNEAKDYLTSIRKEIQDLRIEHSTSKHGVITVSIGFMSLEENFPNDKEIYNLVDNAMYKAKRKGKNRIEEV